MKKRLLIIEDEKSVATQLKWGLGKEYDIAIAGDAGKARKLLSSEKFPVATLDLGLPPFPDTTIEGFSLLEAMPEIAPQTRIIVITGNAEEENAMQAVALGAVDFCAKPLDLKELRIILERTFHMWRLEEANRRLEKQNARSGGLCGLIGISPVMERIFSLIRQAGRTEYPVLIEGGTGTGKEMAAMAVHQLSSRADNPMIIINCGAIPENLIESELFGHEKGAFTGALQRRIGRFEQADGGTVFLDEIGELPLAMQVKLLRVLQESTIERLGSNRTIQLDVRIIAATNVDLKDAVTAGKFREDLFFRLNVFHLKMPDLKERSEDVYLLAQHFLREESAALDRGQISFSSDALEAMSSHEWPGNVRELQNIIRRALGTTSGRIITALDMGLAAGMEDPHKQEVPTLRQAREAAERDAVTRALALTGNNISKAAKVLEISRPTLHDLIKKLGIKGK